MNKFLRLSFIVLNAVKNNNKLNNMKLGPLGVNDVLKDCN